MSRKLGKQTEICIDDKHLCKWNKLCRWGTRFSINPFSELWSGFNNSWTIELTRTARGRIANNPYLFVMTERLALAVFNYRAASHAVHQLWHFTVILKLPGWIPVLLIMQLPLNMEYQERVIINAPSHSEACLWAKINVRNSPSQLEPTMDHDGNPSSHGCIPSLLRSCYPTLLTLWYGIETIYGWLDTQTHVYN